MHEIQPPPATRLSPWLTTAFSLVSVGAALGAAEPQNRSVTPAHQTAPAARTPAVRTAARPPVPEPPPGWMELGAVEPGRGYAPVGAPADEEALAPAPDLVIPAHGARTAPADRLATPTAEGTAARRSPAASIRPSAASGLPLLAVRRGSGRIVFHEIAAGGTADAELEGEWAVVGRCGERLQLHLAQPARAAGVPRGVGADVSASAGWQAAVVVPGQGCAAATGRTLRPGRPTAADRERFAAAGLRQVVATADAAWLVFADGGRSRAVVALRRGGAWRVAWSRESDGAQELAAVFRRGDGWEGVFVTLRGGSPDTLQRVRVAGDAALPDTPAPLRG